jgi:RNase P protein component
VQRNRVRRRLRTVLAPQLATLGGVDLVISIAPPGGDLSSAAVTEHLGRALAGALAALALRTASGAPAREVATARLLPA